MTLESGQIAVGGVPARDGWTAASLEEQAAAIAAEAALRTTADTTGHDARPHTGVIFTGTQTIGAKFTARHASAVANLAAMNALTGMDFGCRCWVTTQLCEYFWAGTAWLRDISTSSPTWLAQATWFIDPANATGLASDENTGIDETHPILTDDERQARWGSGRPVISLAIAIRFLSAAPRCYVCGLPASSACSLTVSGTATALQTTTISAFTTFSHGTYPSVAPLPTILSAADITDWTSYAATGVRLRSNTLLAWTDIVNPNGGGITTVSSSPWGSMATTGAMAFTASNPAVSAPLVIETCSTVGEIFVDWQSGTGTSTSVPHILLRDMTITGGCNILGANTNNITNVYGCRFTSTARPRLLNPLGYGSYTLVGSGVSSRFDCYVTQAYAYQGCYFSSGSYVVLSAIGSGYAVTYSLARQSGTYACYQISANGGEVGIAYSQGFAANGAVIRFLYQWAGCVIIYDVSGRNAGTTYPAVTTVEGSNVIFAASKAYNLTNSIGVDIGRHNAVIGTSGWKFSHCANGLTVGAWAGTGTLTDGSLAVALSPQLTFFFPSGSSIQVCYVTPKASAPALGYGSVTTSGFVVTNGDTGDDTSVVAWTARGLGAQTTTVTPMEGA